MEGLETAAAATPAPAPVAPAAPAAPAAELTPSPAAPSSSGGGSMGSVKEALQSLNWIEVIFGALGTAALLYTVYYYRYQTMSGKSMNTEIQNRLDDLAIKVADLQSATQRDELLGNPQQGFDGMFY